MGKKGELALKNFESGCNCSQAVLLAFAPECGLDRETALRLASSFGGVISPMLGKLGDSQGLPTVLWVLVGCAVLACLGSFLVPDAPDSTHAEPKPQAQQTH